VPANALSKEGATRGFEQHRINGCPPKNNKNPSMLNQRNREFHFAICETARHSTLMELIEPLWVRCGPCTLALFEELGHEQIKHGASTHHQTALDAIREHRPDDAYDATVTGALFCVDATN
jgi:DNA-binding GntR family transcriptional regulator